VQPSAQTAASEPDLEAADRACPEKRDTGGERESEHEPGHCDPPGARKARDSLTGYGASATVVRAGREPAVSIGPLAVNEILQVTTASSGYPPERQLASTYGFLPWSPGRQRVS
jgi:hypothetical protein